MWLVRLRSSATTMNSVKDPRFGRAFGAYVNCMISFADAEGAIQLAKFYTTATGEWRVSRVISCQTITRRQLRGNSSHLQFFDEAEIDGYSLIFHIYPRDVKLAKKSALVAAAI